MFLSCRLLALSRQKWRAWARLSTPCASAAVTRMTQMTWSTFRSSPCTSCTECACPLTGRQCFPFVMLALQSAAMTQCLTSSMQPRNRNHTAGLILLSFDAHLCSWKGPTTPYTHLSSHTSVRKRVQQTWTCTHLYSHSSIHTPLFTERPDNTFHTPLFTEGPNKYGYVQASYMLKAPSFILHQLYST